MSRSEQWPSLVVVRIQPSRLATRQQWVSTGKTSRSSEYIMTQRATFFPTLGRVVRKASHSTSL